MSNSLFNLIGSPTPPVANNDFLIQFNQFRSMFTGNPQEQVQKLLQNGQMTQDQFNDYAQKATQLRSLIK